MNVFPQSTGFGVRVTDLITGADVSTVTLRVTVVVFPALSLATIVMVFAPSARVTSLVNVPSVPTVTVAPFTVDHDDMEEDIVYTFNHCQNCDECFISKHPFDEENGDGFIYASSSPVKSCEQNFSEAITSLSPNFVSIYKQAALAESLGLDQICGIGYRKAIEFLVKDYTIHKSPNSKDAILKATLGSCISNYIKDDRLTTLARAATWLGNDETHYVRQHPDYTLKELKAFADAFITFIDADLAYEAALKLVTP